MWTNTIKLSSGEEVKFERIVPTPKIGGVIDLNLVKIQIDETHFMWVAECKNGCGRPQFDDYYKMCEVCFG